jgi:hypothetical protein
MYRWLIRDQKAAGSNPATSTDGEGPEVLASGPLLFLAGAAAAWYFPEKLGENFPGKTVEARLVNGLRVGELGEKSLPSRNGRRSIDEI